MGGPRHGPGAGLGVAAPRRIGFFGGSFNPVHVGHVLLARRALEALRLDQVLLVPCASSADGKALAPGALRLRWLHKALQGQPGLKAWDGELRRGGVSRTVDSLRELRATLGPGVRFWLLLGEDQLVRLHRWKEAEVLPSLARLVVLARSGSFRPVRFRGAYQRVALGRFDISSTEIRSRIRKGLTIQGYLPERVIKDGFLMRCYRSPQKLSTE